MVRLSRRHCFRKRSQRGALALLFSCGMIVISAALLALATDLSHFLAVKNELQNATDAAALAGAADLLNSPANAESDARLTAAKNTADGQPVQSRGNTSLQVIVTPPTDTAFGSVEVQGSVRIRNILGGIIGRFFDVVTADSIAGTRGSLKQIYAGQLFPIAVSIDASINDGADTQIPLYQCQDGQAFRLYINSTDKNCAFTSLTQSPSSDAFIRSCMGECLGLGAGQHPVDPAVNSGDTIYITESQGETQDIANDPLYSALLNNVLILPVIQGSAPFNQTATCLGFIGFKPTAVVKNDSGVRYVSGILVKAQPLGLSGISAAIGTAYAGQLSNLAAGPIQLIR